MQEQLALELEKFRQESGHLYEFPIADLVMMQMIGNFDSFIASVPTMPPKQVLEAIEETRKLSTTSKLFPGIVDKTIEAQFGEKHAALRELAQNALDAYNANDSHKRILFDLSEENSFWKLTIRDFGVGMDLKGLIRDLLIPYNSAKEFDPTKIGEHGIGWYSIVDMAKIVKVVTRKRSEEKGSQALIYRDKEYMWQTVLLPVSSNGFNTRFNTEHFGTEVAAYIPKEATSKTKIRDYLYQYLGMVSLDNGTIQFGSDIINSIRGEYRTSEIVWVTTGTDESMFMGVSKRIMQGDTSDSRFVFRNQNIGKVLYTQRGLFVKFDDIIFDNESIHYKLVMDLSRLGLDFWVDIPSNVTLTKGRNNIIADHVPQVLEGMYKCFESTFLDIILCDQEILDHPSNTIPTSIAQIFDQGYKESIALVKRREYTLKKRIVSRAIAVSSGIVDILKLIGGFFIKTSGSLWKAANQPLPPPPIQLWFGIGLSMLLTVAVYGIVEFLDHFGLKIFLQILYGITAIAAVASIVLAIIQRKHILFVFEAIGYILLEAAKSAGNFLLTVVKIALFLMVHVVKKLFKGISWGYIVLSIKEIRYKELLSIPLKIIANFGGLITIAPWMFIKMVWENIAGFRAAIGPACMKLLNLLGLYVDMEERKEKKRNKQRKRISKKYLTGLYKNGFFKKIVNKKIIPATRIEITYERPLKKPSLVKEVWGEFKEFFNNATLPYDPYANDRGAKKISRVDERISIDNLIDYHLRGKIYFEDSGYRSDGDIIVNKNHPIVKMVVGKLNDISGEIKERYNVKLFEDHLENVLSFIAGTLFFIYSVLLLFSPLAAMILLLSLLPNPDPYGYSSYYGSPSDHRNVNITAIGFCITSVLCAVYFCWRMVFKKENILRNYALFKFMKKVIKGLFRRTIRMGSKLTKKDYSIGNSFQQSLALGRDLGVRIGVGIGSVLYILFIRLPYLIVLYGLKAGRWSCIFLVKLPGMLAERSADNKAAREAKEEERKKQRAERKKQKAEKRKAALEEKQRKKERRKDLWEHTSLFTKSYHSVLEWYHKSWIYYLFGFGEYQEKDFKDVGRIRTEFLVKTVGAGQSYVDYITVVENLDSLMARILDLRPLNFVYYNSVVYRATRSDNAEFMTLTPRSKFFVDLAGQKRKVNILLHDIAFTITLPITTRSYAVRDITGEDLISNKSLLATFTMETLDRLLHIRAHLFCEVNYAEHGFVFWETKRGYLRKITQYIEENKIDLPARVASWMKSSKEDPLYNISIGDFSRIVKMPLRRLKYQKYEFEKERQECFGKKAQKDFDNKVIDRNTKISRNLPDKKWREYNTMRNRVLTLKPAELDMLIQNQQCPFEPEYLGGIGLEPFECDFCGRVIIPGEKHP
jgi:hypothetical protein